MLEKAEHKLSTKHAIYIISVSVLLSLIFGIFQVLLDFENENKRIQNDFQHILELSHDTAAQASYQLNETLSDQVVQGLLSYPGIIYASLHDDFQSKLAESSLPPLQGNWLTKTIASRLLDGTETLNIALTHRSVGQALPVGKLVIGIDPIQVSRQFIQRAGISFLFSLLKTFLLACILSLVFYYSLSRPLLQISKWVDATLKDAHIVDLPPKHNPKDEIGLLIAAFTRVWKGRDQAISQLKEYAYYDLLTGVANRRLITDKLHEILLNKHHYQKVSVLIYIDLDRFKAINDSLGHAVGDVLLVNVAKRLTHLVDEHATVGRLGGDEFVVFLPYIASTTAEARLLAQNIAESIIESLSQPHEIAGHSLFCTASLGIDLLNNQSNHVHDILRNADTALYKVKSEGGNTFHFYSEDMFEKVSRRLAIEQGLHNAIQDNQLSLAYQPIVNMHGRMIGAEAFLRWHHPELGIIEPAEFIPIAETSNTIMPISHWLMETAFQQIAQWTEKTLPLHFERFSINISPMCFLLASFPRDLRQLLDKHQCNSKHIELDLTEVCFYNNESKSMDTLTLLKNMGLSLALDDFGSGYSSLRYFKNDHFDTVKLDRSMIENIHEDETNQVVLESILSLAKRFHMGVIAEGIETTAELALCKQLGCTKFQGFYFSKPLTKEEFEAALFPVTDAKSQTIIKQAR